MLYCNLSAMCPFFPFFTISLHPFFFGTVQGIWGENLDKNKNLNRLTSGYVTIGKSVQLEWRLQWMKLITTI